MKAPRLCLVLMTAGAMAAAALADEEAVPPRRPGALVFGFGPMAWADVHDLDPSGSPIAEYLGRFHTWGTSLELAYQRRVAQRGRTRVLAGIDFGIFASENSKDLDAVLLPTGARLDGDLLARGLFLTSGVRVVPNGESRMPFLFGAGLGWYLVDFAQLFEGGFEASELFEESAPGAYLSAGLDLRSWKKRPWWRMRLEAKVHFVDFGSADRYAPGAGSLTGPIHTMLIGFVWDP